MMILSNIGPFNSNEMENRMMILSNVRSLNAKLHLTVQSHDASLKIDSVIMMILSKMTFMIWHHHDDHDAPFKSI